MLVFSEFGRRMRDNASGTDHGTGGGAFIIGDSVNGGLYAEYPSLDPSRWANGEDLEHTIDFPRHIRNAPWSSGWEWTPPRS